MFRVQKQEVALEGCGGAGACGLLQGEGLTRCWCCGLRDVTAAGQRGPDPSGWWWKEAELVTLKGELGRSQVFWLVTTLLFS